MYKKSPGGPGKGGKRATEFRKPGGSRGNQPFKKSAPDRGAGDGGERPYKKPYRAADGGGFGGAQQDKPFRKRPDDRAAGGEGNYKKPFRAGSTSDGDKPYKKRTPQDGKFDGSARSGRDFKKPYRANESGAPGDRKDKPYSKPFRERKDEGGSDFKRPAREGFDKDRAPRDRGDKPYSKPFRERKEDGGDFKRPAREGFDKDRAPRDRGDKPYSKPFRERKDDGGDSKRPAREGFDKKRAPGKPPFGKPRGADAPAGDEQTRKQDSRPFRERQQFAAKPTRSKAPEATEDGAEPQKKFADVVKNVFNGPKKKADETVAKREQHEDKVYGELKDVVNENAPKKPYELKHKSAGLKKKDPGAEEVKKPGRKRRHEEDEEEENDDEGTTPASDEMPLNKFIAHSGECSRREAAEMVKQGKVKVNGELVLDPGYRVKREDMVTMGGKKLTPTKGFVYILLNKPKGYITTNEDPQGRKTVMDLVSNTGIDRLYPVGRLDRDTSGLLLITNDGDLTQRLSHPSHNIKKVYQVTLDKPLTKADFEKIVEGVELEDGKADVDALAYLELKNELGLEIHSGRNRIVRRIFESLGYVVEKLDRVMYAGLTKKNLPRSKWRFLDPREIVLLKHFKN